MAYEPDRHYKDPDTGFLKHVESGRILNVEEIPPAFSTAAETVSEWPKWVKPHDSHVRRTETEGAPDHVSVPGFEQCHLNRTNGEVTVLANNEDDEKRAEAEYKEPEAGETSQSLSAYDEVERKKVHAETERAKAAEDQKRRDAEMAEQARLEDEETDRRVKENVERQQRTTEEGVKMAQDRHERLGSEVSERRDDLLTPSAQPASFAVGSSRGDGTNIEDTHDTDHKAYRPEGDAKADGD